MIAATSSHNRRGFTLIELMVVILIIAILAALLMAAISRNPAEDARTLTEISQMASAIEAYRMKYGEYPPVVANSSDTNQDRIRSHLARAFPRYMIGLGAANDPVPTLANLKPDQALVFWLGGMPVSADGSATGDGKGTEGFSSDPANPFATTQFGTWSERRVVAPAGLQRTEPFFRFDPLRLRVRDASAGGDARFWVYVPFGKQSAYVYFPSNTYGQSATAGRPIRHTMSAAGPTHTAVPYRTAPVNNASDLNNTTGWAAPGTFQIIAAGKDDIFGETGAAADFRIFPSGQNYSTNGYDDDNLTNFSRIPLGKAKP